VIATTTSDSTTSSSGATSTTGGPIVIQTSSGGEPGLYGGTQDDQSCDPELLVAFLEANPDKAAAWAGVHGIDPSEIAEYVDGLTPLTLLGNTRVTNHGFRDGVATPRQSVLEGGTKVLVDDRGLPRVRCKCGNPLLEPVATPTTPTYVGDAWPNFDPARVDVIEPSPEPLTEFIVTNPETGDRFVRPVGTTGGEDRELVPPTTTTAEPTTTTTPEPVDITAQGVSGATSEFSGGGESFPAALAVDNDRTTSWFSAGEAFGPTQTFVWELPAATMINEVQIIGNGEHPDYPTGFGFEQVTVRLFDDADAVVFEQVLSLAGTPDPNVSVAPGIEGRRVELFFEQAESPDCGGFAELIVTGPG
jgi:hypothetical protein